MKSHQTMMKHHKKQRFCVCWDFVRGLFFGNTIVLLVGNLAFPMFPGNHFVWGSCFWKGIYLIPSDTRGTNFEVFCDGMAFPRIPKSCKSSLRLFPVTRFRETWRKLIVILFRTPFQIPKLPKSCFPLKNIFFGGWGGAGWGDLTITH